MKQIKASEVKPGMEVQFDLSGWDVKGTVGTAKVLPHSVWIYTEKCCEMSLDLDSPVTVLSEPQPEEPTTFGARVIQNGTKIVRASEGRADDLPWLEEGSGYWRTWDQVCARGPVTVVPDQGWTVPDDTPEVPERIEEWPESDTALRPYKWRDEYGEIWRHGSNSHVEGWTSGYLFQNRPVYGPWDRVTDDTPEVPERIEEWPEDDSHLREQRWRDRLGRMWCHGFTGFDTGWTCGSLFRGRPACGPWDRVTDA